MATLISLCLIFIVTACTPISTEIANENTDTPLAVTKTMIPSSPTPLGLEETATPISVTETTDSSTPTAQIQTTEILPERLKIENGEWKAYTNANYVKAMLVDQEGYIWTAGRGGVVKLDGQTGHYVKYTALDGLVGNFVYSIAQTKDGVLWFGTYGKGLSSFDGQTWKTFTTEDGLPSNSIINLVAAPDGTLWVNTDYIDDTQQGGLVHYDGDKFALSDAPITFDVTAIAPDGTLWAGAYRSGLYRYNGIIWEYMPLIENSGVDITAIGFAPNGDVWVATWSAVLKYNGTSWQNMTPWQEPRIGWVKSIAITSEGAVWIGLALGVQGPYDEEPEQALRHGETFIGLYRYEDGSWTPFTSEDGLVDNEVTSIAIGADGGIWCGSYRYGISRYDGESWQIYQTRAGLLANDIFDMDVSGGDENIRIGLAHYDQGVSYFDSQQWLSYSEYGDMKGGASAIVIESDATMWVGTHEGFAHFDGKEWITYYEEDYFQLESIYFTSDMFVDKFFAGTGWGLIENTQGEWRTLHQVDGEIIREVRLAEDSTLFIATNHGVYTKTDEQWKRYTTQNGLAGNYVLGLGISSDGSVWASSCEGLAQLEGDEWITKIYSDENTGCFRQLVIDQRGTIWIATLSGLLRYNKGISNLVSYPGLSGSAQLFTLDVEIDEAGDIWIATESGLFSYQQ